MNNPLILNMIPAEALTDAYKVGMSMLHDLVVFGVDVKINNSYSNFTPRKNAFMEFSPYSDGKIVVYGTFDSFRSVVALWDNNFFNVDKEVMMKRLKRRTMNVFGTVKEHNKYLTDIAALHDIGHLPIEVRAIREGTRYNLGLPVFTVEATVKSFGWLVNYIETVTSGLFWPMTNTATKVEQFYLQAKHYGSISAPKDILEQWIDICVHEFGMRGYRGTEDQVRTSSAHSLFFLGSDTMAVLDYFENVYGDDSDEDPIVISVRASEHADISRMISLFRKIAEKAIAKNGPDATLPFFERDVLAAAVLEDPELYVLDYIVRESTGIMSYVSDTENYYRLLNEYARQLKDLILNREAREDGQPPIFVFRPDSSRRTPLTVICGYRILDIEEFQLHEGATFESDVAFFDGSKDAYYIWEKGDFLEISADEAHGSLWSLWNTFGGTTVQTEAGEMKLINPAVSLIYGEAISQKHQEEIYERMLEMGFSVVNVLMGKGSYASLESSTRDLFSMSYKQTFSEAELDGEVVNLEQQKTPMGDISKKSAKGLLQVVFNGVDYELNQEVTREEQQTGELKLLLRDGVFYDAPTLKSIKQTYANS